MRNKSRIKKLEEKTNINELETQVIVADSDKDCQLKKAELIKKHGARK